MKIAHIKISQILGTEELELTPAGFNSFSGPNGTGKTSILEAIKSVFKGGHDATLLRNGADKGEIVLVLDNGQSITKRVSADTSTTEVRDTDGKKMARPADAIRTLVDALAVNPIGFLTADKKDRTRVLLDSLPLELDAAKLSKIAGIKVTAQPGVHALQTIEAVAKEVFNERTGTNRAVKEKEATIKQLTDAMPEAPAGVDGDENDIAAKIEEARVARDTLVGKIDAKLNGIKSEAQAKIDELRTKLQADIDALKAAAQQQVDAINADVNDNSARASTARENAGIKFNDATAPLTAALTAIRADRSNAAKREQALETINTMRADLADLVKDAETQTKALTDIEAYKLSLLSELPIKGLEVRDGEIFCDGVIFDRLNTAKQVELAVELAKLRAGALGVVCLDRIECLDADSLNALRDSIAASGMQAFVTRVQDTPEDGTYEISSQD